MAITIPRWKWDYFDEYWIDQEDLKAWIPILKQKVSLFSKFKYLLITYRFESIGSSTTNISNYE